MRLTHSKSVHISLLHRNMIENSNNLICYERKMPGKLHHFCFFSFNSFPILPVIKLSRYSKGNWEKYIFSMLIPLVNKKNSSHIDTTASIFRRSFKIFITFLFPIKQLNCIPTPRIHQFLFYENILYMGKNYLTIISFCSFLPYKNNSWCGLRLWLRW